MLLRISNLNEPLEIIVIGETQKQIQGLHLTSLALNRVEVAIQIPDQTPDTEDKSWTTFLNGTIEEGPQIYLMHVEFSKVASLVNRVSQSISNCWQRRSHYNRSLCTGGGIFGQERPGKIPGINILCLHRFKSG